MAGFLAVLVPVLGLGLGGIELAHWMSLRQALSLVLMDAARAGTTRQASPRAIAEAFEQGLRTIYVQPQAHARALRTRRDALGVPWRIVIRQPAPAAFLDHADAALEGPRPGLSQPSIRNDYQAAQHAHRIRQGWPQGRGPRSGRTIFEANTLSMDLWWPQAPLAPGVSAIVRALAPLQGDPIGRRMMEKGYLPFRRGIRLAMQSHPAAWPDLPDGRVVHDAADTPSGHAGAIIPGGMPAEEGNPPPAQPGGDNRPTDTASVSGQDTWRDTDTADAGTEAPDAAPAEAEAPGVPTDACAP